MIGLDDRVLTGGGYCWDVGDGLFADGFDDEDYNGYRDFFSKIRVHC